MTKIVEGNAKAVLPDSLQDALAGYQATAKLWREATGLVAAKRLIQSETAHGRHWNNIRGHAERRGEVVLANLGVFVDDVPRGVCFQRPDSLDSLGIFSVRMNV